MPRWTGSGARQQPAVAALVLRRAGHPRIPTPLDAPPRCPPIQHMADPDRSVTDLLVALQNGQAGAMDELMTISATRSIHR